MTGKKRTTIYDIAQKLNLNPSSVSRALNNSSSITATTKKLVLKTADEMNYMRNTIASNLRKGLSKTIGVVVPRINQNFFANVIAGLEEATYEKGYKIIICQSNESYEKELQCINTLINQHVDCIVISISVETTNYSHLQTVIDRGIQIIQFDRVVDQLETLKVINDNEQSSFEAVSHMIEQGYSRIALLEGPQNLNIFKQRKQGYLRALKENNILVLDELQVANAWTKELGEEATRQLLNLPQPPDAIFASTSDFSALGALVEARAKNIKVPEELGICGYSNENFTEITYPSITTLDQFSHYMGMTVANLFFQEMDNVDVESIPKIISIQPKLIVRQSTSRLSQL